MATVSIGVQGKTLHIVQKTIPYQAALYSIFLFC